MDGREVELPSQILDGLPHLANPFDRYLFIEESRSRLDALRVSINTDFAALPPRCELQNGDANTILRTWCIERDWTKDRAVVFLDPYGMQVEWNTIEALAATKGVDLWYLFPLGIGVSRLLTRSGTISTGWQERLTRFFGTVDWRSRFYPIAEEADLFGDHKTVQRNASEQQIESFIYERLMTRFETAAHGLVLRNSKANPLYLLCFAASNQRGAKAALNIAQDILKTR